MSIAVERIIQLGFEKLPINRIFARPFGTNFGSIKVLEKCGFIEEARFSKTIFKNEVYHDEIVYGIRK